MASNAGAIFHIRWGNATPIGKGLHHVYSCFTHSESVNERVYDDMKSVREARNKTMFPAVIR